MGFSYSPALDKKREERKEWDRMKPDFMIDFYVRKGLKGKQPEDIIDFLKYAEILYQGVNDLTDQQMLLVLMHLADHFERRVSAVNSKLIKKGGSRK